MTDATTVFAGIYSADQWNGGSGPGSAPENSVEYREALQSLVNALPQGSRVVDVGCGDWRIGELIDWSNVHYIGTDVVPTVIARNRARYGVEGVIDFEVFDATSTRWLPRADLLIVKDVFQHWPTEAIERFVDRYGDTGGMALITNDVLATPHPRGAAWLNEDIELGGWRCVDVECEPFNLSAAWRLDYPVLDAWVKRTVLLTTDGELPEGFVE